MSHWWVVASQPVDGAYPARCRKCHAETAFKNDTGVSEYNAWSASSKAGDHDRSNMMASEKIQLLSGMYHRYGR